MRTELLKLDGAADAAKIAQAVQQLREGGIVAFPTETVYALGADARNPEALARLAQIKHRQDRRHAALLVPSLKQAEELAGGFSRPARKLARLFWPGPLTLRVPAGEGGRIGLRLPEHPVARSLLAQCGFALSAPNAVVKETVSLPNGHVEERVLCRGNSAAEVRSHFDGQISLVLEGTPAPRGTLSTMVEITDSELTVLRQGAIPQKAILEAAAPTVLFVCTGNTCRSPMAAAMLRARAHSIYRLDVAPLRVISAGTNAFPGSPAHPYAVQAMREMGIDLSAHKSTLLTPDLIDHADWVFTMTRAHRASILEFMPAAKERVRTLSNSHEDIAEPAGQSLDRYRKCRDQMAVCLRDIFRIIENS